MGFDERTAGEVDVIYLGAGGGAMLASGPVTRSSWHLRWRTTSLRQLVSENACHLLTYMRTLSSDDDRNFFRAVINRADMVFYLVYHDHDSCGRPSNLYTTIKTANDEKELNESITKQSATSTYTKFK